MMYGVRNEHLITSFWVVFQETRGSYWNRVILPGLLGTAAFAFFCFYLLLAVIAGAMMLGLKLVFVTIHPMK